MPRRAMKGEPHWIRASFENETATDEGTCRLSACEFAVSPSEKGMLFAVAAVVALASRPPLKSYQTFRREAVAE